MFSNKALSRWAPLSTLTILATISTVAAADFPTPDPLPSTQVSLFDLAVDCSKMVHASPNPIQSKIISEECDRSQQEFSEHLQSIERWRAYVYGMEELDGGGVRGLRLTLAVPYQYEAPGMLATRSTRTYSLPMYITNGYLPNYRIKEDDPLYAVVAGLAIGQLVEVSGDLIDANVGENWEYPTSINVSVTFKSIDPD